MDNEIRIESAQHRHGVRGLLLMCKNFHFYRVRRGNFKADTWPRFCLSCPWRCEHCGNEDPDDRRFTHRGREDVMRSRCRRCDAAYVHGVSWETYCKWVCLGCAICGGRERLHVDHDHAHCPGPKGCKDCARGLLCMRHNIMVGLLENQDKRLDSYLQVGDELERLKKYLS